MPRVHMRTIDAMWRPLLLLLLVLGACDDRSLPGWKGYRLDDVPPDLGPDAKLWAASPDNVWVASEQVYRMIDGELRLDEELQALAPKTGSRPVWGTSATDVWARDIAHYDGHRWTLYAAEPPAYYPFSVLWGSAPDKYILLSSEQSRAAVLARQWDGSRWASVGTAWSLDTYGLPEAVYGTGPADVHVVAVDAFTLAHFDGRQWQILPAPTIEGKELTFRAVWARSPTEAYAVGGSIWIPGQEPVAAQYDPRPMVARYDGQAWRVVEAPGHLRSHGTLLTGNLTPVCLNSVTGCGDLLLVASGAEVFARRSSGPWESYFVARDGCYVTDVFCVDDAVAVFEWCERVEKGHEPWPTLWVDR